MGYYENRYADEYVVRAINGLGKQIWDFILDRVPDDEVADVAESIILKLKVNRLEYSDGRVEQEPDYIEFNINRDAGKQKKAMKVLLEKTPMECICGEVRYRPGKGGLIGHTKGCPHYVENPEWSINSSTSRNIKLGEHIRVHNIKPTGE